MPDPIKTPLHMAGDQYNDPIVVDAAGREIALEEITAELVRLRGEVARLEGSVFAGEQALDASDLVRAALEEEHRELRTLLKVYHDHDQEFFDLHPGLRPVERVEKHHERVAQLLRKTEYREKR